MESTPYQSHPQGKIW